MKKQKRAQVTIWTLVMIVFIQVLAVLYPLIMDLFVEKDPEADTLYELLKPLLHIRMPIILWLPGITVLVLVWVYFKNRYDQEIQQYEEQINDHGRTLLKKYEELNDYQAQKIISDTVKTFAERYEDISAVQLYRYTAIPQNNEIVFRVTHEHGYAKEGIEINAMLQNYYRITPSLYNDFKRVLKEYKNILSYLEFDETQSQENLPATIHSSISYILKYIHGNIHDLSVKPSQDFTIDDVYKFAFVVDAFNILRQSFPGIPSFFLDPDKYKLLSHKNHQYRTGILRGIILDHFFTFEYIGGEETSKQGRKYVTHPFELKSRLYIILISINQTFLPAEEVSHVRHLTFLVEELSTMLSQNLSLVYNKDENGGN